MTLFEQQLTETTEWMACPRFADIVRLHTAQQVIEQRGAIFNDFPIARSAAEGFFQRLRQLRDANGAITTFGPYSPGQAVVMKRMGIEGIYLGGWATSAKGGAAEDPGADLASYPLSQVPDEGAAIVRALLAADRNQSFARARARNDATEASVDYRPFIIADADTGHGGEAHVRNLIRRFVEAGVPGYHIEDQKPGVKKCGHQGGKVLVAQHEQIQRLNAARLQLDIMRVPGIIVARTDAEAANLIDSIADERDHPFVLGATATNVPAFKTLVVAVHRALYERGVDEIRGHFMFSMPDSSYDVATRWLAEAGLMTLINECADATKTNGRPPVDVLLETVIGACIARWQTDAALKTFSQAAADALKLNEHRGGSAQMTSNEWLAFAKHASLSEMRERADRLGVRVTWNCELARTPEGFYPVRGGIDYAIARSLAVAPFADLLWMETKTANLHEAAEFAKAIHAQYPQKMLAYNLSPSFNWDTTGMTDDEMRMFPTRLAELGYVFNFVTYGGHQIDGLAAEEFAGGIKQDGMLALARLQRKFRLLNSPYRTPQTLVGGARMDAALMASSGRTATTQAMGEGSTQHQHMVDVEASPAVLQRWLRSSGVHIRNIVSLQVEIRPVVFVSDLL